MTPRTEKLKQESLAARPSISHERAVLITDFYQAHEGHYSVPTMRARSFLHLCERKAIYLGEGELIVGERGPAPKQTPTFPELTCHSMEELQNTEFAGEDALQRRAGNAPGLRREDHPVLARTLNAGQDVRPVAGRMAPSL